MALGRERPEQRGMAELLTNLADGVGRLVTQHIALAKLELGEDLKNVGTGAGKVVAFVPFLLVGSLFLCAGLVALMGPRVGYFPACALVAAANLATGAIGILLALRRMSERRVMNDSLQEFR